MNKKQLKNLIVYKRQTAEQQLLMMLHLRRRAAIMQLAAKRQTAFPPKRSCKFTSIKEGIKPRIPANIPLLNAGTMNCYRLPLKCKTISDILQSIVVQSRLRHLCLSRVCSSVVFRYVHCIVKNKHYE